jgi:tetratricopeptide (TPR) repeat protein
VRLAVVLVLSLAACLPARPPRTGAFGREPAPPAAYAEYIRGRAASASGEHAEAAVHFRAAARLAPDDASLRVAVADELLAAGELEAADAEAAALLSRWADEPDAWIVRGHVAARRGRLAEAGQLFDKAIAVAPDAPRAYLLAGMLHTRRRDVAAARRAYQRLLARHPAHGEAHLRLARLLGETGDWVGAEQHLVRALAAEPDDIEARVWLARAYQRLGKRAEAAASLREAYDRSGEDPWVGEQLFRAFLDGGDRDAALGLLADLDGGHRSASARLAFAGLYLVVRRADDALRIIGEVLASQPERHDARLLAARAHAQKGDRAAAIAAATAVPVGSEEYPSARAFAGEQTHRSGKRAEAIALLEAALVDAPGAVALLAELALLYQRAGRVGDARRLLGEARADRPGDLELVFALAGVEERDGQPERAAELLRREVLAGDPDHVGALNLIGYVYASHGVSLAQAEPLLARAVELAPDDGYVLDSWGLLLLRRGRLAEAGEVLARADRLAPEEPEILAHLGELALAKGDRAAGEAYFVRALALDPEEELIHRIEKLRGGQPATPKPRGESPKGG